MKVKLTQFQRIVVAGIYVLILIGIFYWLGGNFKSMLWDASNDKSLWFYSGVLLIILGKYIVEPYFSKPTDVLANTVAVMIGLIGLNRKSDLLAYDFILIFSISIFLITVFFIVIKDSEKKAFKWLSAVLYWIAINLGNSKVIFSLVYLSAIYTYVANANPPDTLGFIVLTAFWICVIFFDIAGKFVEFVVGFKFVAIDNKKFVGKAIGCENPLLYKIEVANASYVKLTKNDLIEIEIGNGVRIIGIVVGIKHLVTKKWITVNVLIDNEENLISYTIKSSWRKNTINEKNAYLIDSLDYIEPQVKDFVLSNELYKRKADIIGYIDEGSNVNIIKFQIIDSPVSRKIREGLIVSVNIKEILPLYQIIDGKTHEDKLENEDKFGYIVGTARKIGLYNAVESELNTVPWMPEMYSPVFLMQETIVDANDLKKIAKKSIGRLPNTSYGLPIKDYNALVTHNTAILGILGIGKSCLTFELIQKCLLELSELKIICIDITNEYGAPDKLPTYINPDFIETDTPDAFNSINSKCEHIESDGAEKFAKEIPDKSGNLKMYKDEIRDDLIKFLQLQEENVFKKRVRIFNPEYHKASIGEKMGVHVMTRLLSPAEKTRIICEEVLKILMKSPIAGSSKAKVLIVFEEAHSLVPEWNSIANEGDKSAVNGTAKVILQGRKYGLGSLVITQRTANISKSILNQCNTIFALRVFDDTGKQFLENYIGSDYANTLPTLEERHCIAVGKALKLKQPVIIKLNDSDNVERVIKNEPDNVIE